MQPKTISGVIKPPEEKKQKQLHRQLGEFADWMKQEKDTTEIQKDRRKSVPILQLQMVF